MREAPAAATHRPSIAAGPEAAGPRRSLILAGGGMRVAYQAGVIRALADEGLRFHHADGTSGGIFNLAMLLSGVEPDDMCRRWETLPVSDFVSFLPFKDYVRSPHLPALGGPAGITGKVFPHLGIDAERIRSAAGMAGTFNVCNYTDKVNVAIPHTQVDRDLLVAGVSLPIFIPPLRRDGTVYMDSVWIRDANILEAVRRGADELWLVWCIGNVPEYHDGLFNQYVHMIEIAANGRLFEDLQSVTAINAQRVAQGREPIRLHVVKPRAALPLDPVYYSGGISGEELVAMGYRDAAGYLDHASPAGVPLDPDATRMQTAPPGRRVVEVMTAERWAPADGLAATGGPPAALRLVVEALEPQAGRAARGVAGRVCGTATLPGVGTRIPLRGGTLEVTGAGRSDAAVRYRAACRASGARWSLEVVRRGPADPSRAALTVRRGDDGSGPVAAIARLREDTHTVDAVLRTLHLADPHPLRDRVHDLIDRLRGLLGRGSRAATR